MTARPVWTVLPVLLLLGGNGGVVWAETRIASGLAAVLVATTPLWMALFDRKESTPAGPRVLGFAGIVLLLGPGALQARDAPDLVGTVAVTVVFIVVGLGAKSGGGQQQGDCFHR